VIIFLFGAFLFGLALGCLGVAIGFVLKLPSLLCLLALIAVLFAVRSNG
jgi:hypothetical protein